MAKLITPKFEKQRYVLNADRGLPPEQQTVFILKPLSVRDMTEVKNLIACDTKRVSAAHYAARRGIVGWENLEGLDFQGRLYPMDANGDREKRCSDGEWDTIAAQRGGEWVEEIGLFLIELAQMGETEKNS